MRIFFAGSPAIAVPALEAVFALAQTGDGFELAGVLTNPDSPRSRGGQTDATDVGAAARRLSEGIVVLKPEKLDGAVREQVAALKPDLLVSFAYGRIFGPKFLSLFPLGGINIHPSLLPKYRGPAPIPAVILNGDAKTGITIQRLALEMDSGDILLQEEMPLNGRETAATLGARTAEKAAALLPDALRGIAAAGLKAKPQNHDEATYCPLLAKNDGCIDWNKSVREIDAQIRAFTPWPLCRTNHEDTPLVILQAEPYEGVFSEAGNPDAYPGKVLGIDKKKGILIQTGSGILAVTALQYQAKKALEWWAFLNGARNFIGAVLR